MRQTQVGFLSLLLLRFNEELRSGFDLLHPSCPAGLQGGTEVHCQDYYERIVKRIISEHVYCRLIGIDLNNTQIISKYRSLMLSARIV